VDSTALLRNVSKSVILISKIPNAGRSMISVFFLKGFNCYKSKDEETFSKWVDAEIQEKQRLTKVMNLLSI